MSSTDSNTETKKLKTSRLRNTNPTIKTSPPIKNPKGKQQQQQQQQPVKSQNSSTQKSISNWTESKRAHKLTAVKNEHLPLPISNPFND